MNEIQTKIKEEIKKLQIANKKAIGDLISKDLVKAVLKDVVKSVSDTFLEMPKKAAAEISTIFISPGVSEKDVEKLLAKHISEALKSLAENMDRLSKGMY